MVKRLEGYDYRMLREIDKSLRRINYFLDKLEKRRKEHE